MKAFSRKRTLLVVFVLALILAVSAACNGGGDDPAPTAPTPAPAPTVAPDDPPPPPPAEDPTEAPADEAPASAAVGGIHQPRDLGGAVLTSAMWWEGGLAYAMSGPMDEEPDPATSTNYFRDRMIWDNARRVEQEFNMSFGNYVSPGSMEIIPSLTASVMAGEAMADLVIMEGWFLMSAVQGDLILPLDQIDLPGSDLLGPRNYTRPSAEGFGHMWSFNTASLDANAVAMGVNLDIINAIGAPNPQDLYNQGLWTWEAMLDIMRTATTDTTGDGLIDQWGIAGQPGEILRNFIGSNDGSLATDDFEYAFDHPNTMEALEFMNAILSEGLWYSDPAQEVATWDWGRNFFAFELGNAAFFPSATWAIDDRSPLAFEFAIVPVPTGPSNTSGATWLGGWRQGYTIPVAGAWDPADVLMIVEEVFSWSGDEHDLLSDGAVASARAVFLTEECVQNQLAATHTMRSDMGYNVPEYPWQLDRFVNAFIAGEMTVAQAVETYRGPLQEMLDNFRQD